jgi:HD superfamily phosphohydrolase
MVIEYREKIQKIFSDVPSEHKFWLVSGGELKNLEELSMALEQMPDDVFLHHVNESKNDFGEWVKNVIKDEELSDTMFKIKTKESTLKAVKLRINSLKNLQQIHEAIDKMKNDIQEKNQEFVTKHDLDEIKEDDFKLEEKDIFKSNSGSSSTLNQPIPELPKDIPSISSFASSQSTFPSHKFNIKEFFMSPALYIGLLVGFGIGIMIGLNIK